MKKIYLTPQTERVLLNTACPITDDEYIKISQETDPGNTDAKENLWEEDDVLPSRYNVWED